MDEAKLLMQSKFFSTIFLFCLFAGLLFLALNQQNVEADSNTTLTVPDQYATIQQAINAAHPGDTVFIKNGTYNEHVSANKTLQIIVENDEASIIDGGGQGARAVITVNSDGVFDSADNTTIANLTLTDSGNRTLDCGLMLNNVDNCDITNVHIVANNALGIWLNNSGHNTIEDTLVQNNNLTGILVTYASENNINHNTVSNNAYGIAVTTNSSENFIVSNVTGSAWFGIDIANSSKNIVNLNHVEESQHVGIMIEQSTYNLIYANNVTSNNVDIWLDTSSSNTIRKNDIQGNSLAGAWLANSSINSFLENYVAYNSGYGFWINYSNNNNIFHNNIISNSHDAYINSSINAWARARFPTPTKGTTGATTQGPTKTRTASAILLTY